MPGDGEQIDPDTVVTRVYDLVGEAPFPDGITHRVVRNALTEAWQGHEAEVITRRAELWAQLGGSGHNRVDRPRRS
jgi:hypothetical protein